MRPVHAMPVGTGATRCGLIGFHVVTKHPMGVTCVACIARFTPNEQKEAKMAHEDAQPVITSAPKAGVEKPQRQVTLETAIGLTTGQRREEWGPVDSSFNRVAAGWAPIFGTEVTAHQVALAMVWLKVARALESPESMDSYVDMAGYGGLASELAKGGHHA